MAKRRPPTVNSFDPQYLEAFRKGALGGVVLELPSWTEARTLRNRLNKLRIALRAADHPQSHLADRVAVTLTWGTRAGYPPVDEDIPLNRKPPSDPPCKLIIQSPFAEHRDVFERAGIKMDYAADVSNLEAELGNLVPPDNKH